MSILKEMFGSPDAKLKKLSAQEVKASYPLAYDGMQLICDQVKDNDPDMFEEDPWSPDGFNYYSLDPDDGTLIAERQTRGMGTREPDFVWSAAIVDNPHDARWFTSEDAEGDEVALGKKLTKICPGGLGGWL